MGEFTFSVALQGAINRGRGAGGGWASFLSLSPFKARSIAVEAQSEPEGHPRAPFSVALQGALPLSLSPFKARSIAVEAQAEPEGHPRANGHDTEWT